MYDAEIEALRKAIVSQHSGAATFVRTAIVRETWQGKTVWNGVVHIYDMSGNPLAKRAYAWSEPVEGSGRREFYVALHVPPVDSAKAAVRASIVHRNRQ